MVGRGQPPKSRRGAGIVNEAAVRSDPFWILVAEHALLRQQFARALAIAQKVTNGVATRRALIALSDSLRLHQRREDLVLYPACERLFGGKDGTASVLRNDHTEIRERLAGLLREQHGRGPVSPVRIDMIRLHMEDHFGKEERLLFPMMAALITRTESAALARRLRAAPRT